MEKWEIWHICFGTLKQNSPTVNQRRRQEFYLYRLSYLASALCSGDLVELIHIVSADHTTALDLKKVPYRKDKAQARGHLFTNKGSIYFLGQKMCAYDQAPGKLSEDAVAQYASRSLQIPTLVHRHQGKAATTVPLSQAQQEQKAPTK
ncbi:hypothetical protein CIB48_g12049 [Xylaria polymorpha]|nr:hypothetical protein CIB48_g12049 [Xylaria polymorpha]